MTASSPIVPAPKSARLQEFWHWWTGELRAMLPARAVAWAIGDVAVTDVMVDAEGIRIVTADAKGTRVPATTPAADIANHPAIRELRAKGNDHVRLLLTPDQVLQKSLTLPAAIEENLREVMGFELDRHTPFTASQVYYDVKLLRRDAQREVIDVLLAVVARNTVNPLLATLRSAGLSVDAISIAGDHTGGQAMELLPATEKPARKWGNQVKLKLGLLALALLLALLALLLPIWQKRDQVISLNPLVGKASAEFEANQRVFDEYTKLANEYNYITGKKQSTYSTLAIIEELTRISPDTTYLQSMELKTGAKSREVTLTGEALAASKVIEVLEQSPMFQNATQKSPTRRGSLGTNEWFNIATDLKTKPLPSANAAEAEKPAEIPPAAMPTTLAPPPPPPAGGADASVKAPTTAPAQPVAGANDKAQPPVATVVVPPPAKPAPAEPPATSQPASPPAPQPVPRKQP